jgi:hypothetical protein
VIYGKAGPGNVFARPVIPLYSFAKLRRAASIVR